MNTICKACGKQISENINHCPFCGTPTGNAPSNSGAPILNAKPNKKESSILSILALIFSLLTITSFVGLILAIIDLCVNDKSKKHTLSAISLFWCGVLLFVLAFASMLSTPSTDSNQPIKTEQTATKAPVKPSKPTAVPDDNIIDVTYNGCSVKYLRHEVSTSSNGEKLLTVVFSFTNNTSANKAYYTTISDIAFQDGVELETSFFYTDDLENNKLKEIQPETTVEVASVYKLNSESDVELEVSEWISFINKSDKMTLSLE